MWRNRPILARIRRFWGSFGQIRLNFGQIGATSSNSGSTSGQFCAISDKSASNSADFGRLRPILAQLRPSLGEFVQFRRSFDQCRAEHGRALKLGSALAHRCIDVRPTSSLAGDLRRGLGRPPLRASVPCLRPHPMQSWPPRRVRQRSDPEAAGAWAQRGQGQAAEGGGAEGAPRPRLWPDDHGERAGRLSRLPPEGLFEGVLTAPLPRGDSLGTLWRPSDDTGTKRRSLALVQWYADIENTTLFFCSASQ